MNILVRMPNWVGDVVMATPVLSDLRARFPSARITAMCKRPVCELLEKDAAIDELFCFRSSGNSFERRLERRNVTAKIRGGQFDVGILLTNSLSSAWCFWQGGVKRRIGFARNWRSLLLTDAIGFPKKGSEHQVACYKRLLEPLGIEQSNSMPRLYVTEHEMVKVREMLRQRGFVEGSKLIGINPGAAYGSAKCWPVERFRALSKKLLAHENVVLAFFGDASMGGTVREICRNLPDRAINLAGATSLRELMCLIRACDLLVTNDSGPMHIGAAFGVPLVALFGSTDEKATGPYGQGGSVIHKHVSCSPCFKRTCPIDFRCMKEISVEDVLTAIRRRGFDV